MINEELEHLHAPTGGVRSKGICNCGTEVPGRPQNLKVIALDAPKILRRNVYGWFDRVERGGYVLTESGREFWPAGPIPGCQGAEGACAGSCFGDMVPHRRTYAGELDESSAEGGAA
jgi:hypothetical protein